MTEILAPAGGMEALKAAIANGADAVYLGGKNFSARAFAQNFSEEELKQAVELCHFYGVKLYLALNTLLADGEIKEALDYLHRAYLMGIDAVILQDTGLLSLAARALPGLASHASTQMSLTNACAVNWLAEKGVSRAIMARELSLDQLKLLKEKSAAELEVFVHGALCISYSGQCLFSSMIGARSGNRGACAQPCRMTYTLLDEKGQNASLLPGEYLLSPRDLYGYLDLERLFPLDLAAWKIEGRMKRPEYVAIVTKVYREALDALKSGGAIVKEEGLRRLLQVFNRDYSCGYWLGNRGAELMSYQRPNNRGLFLGRIGAIQGNEISVRLEQRLEKGDGVEIWVKVGGRIGFTVEELKKDGHPIDEAEKGETVTVYGQGRFSPGDRVFKTSDRRLLAEARRSWEELPPQKLDFTIKAKTGEALYLKAADEDGFRAETVCDYRVEPGKSAADSLALAREQLARLGGTGFVLESLNGEVDQNVLLPKSVLNQARRFLVEELSQKRRARVAPPRRDAAEYHSIIKAMNAPAGAKKAPRLTLTALVADEQVLAAAAKNGAGEIYWQGELYRPLQARRPVKELAALAQSYGALFAPSLPRIITDEETAKWQKEIESWQKAGIKAALAPSLNAIGLLKACSWQGKIYGGGGLNIFNSQAMKFFAEAGLCRVALSPELNLKQLRELAETGLEKEIAVQGALTLMVSEYCPLGALGGGRTGERACSQPCQKQGKHYFLGDRMDYRFPLRFDENCRMHLFNSRELCLAGDLEALQACGVGYAALDLRLYDPKKAEQVAGIYDKAARKKLSPEEAVGELNKYQDGYTKGHLYRGV